MFYFASKVVWALLTPSTALTLLAGVGALLALLGFRRLGPALSLTGVAGLLLAGLSPLGNVLLSALENRFPQGDPARAAAIVVLGGAVEERVMIERGQLALNEAGERVMITVELARRYPDVPIIFSGGTSDFDPATIPEAALVQRALPSFGLPMERLTVESASRTTHENAVLTRALLPAAEGRQVLLVTSAFHMPRAVGTFRRVGFTVIPFAVDFRTAGPDDLRRGFGDVSQGLRRVDLASKEWVGLLGYWVTGRTSALFPAP